MSSFKLFITGDMKRNLELTKALKKSLEFLFIGIYELEVINLLESPNLAIQDNVLVTPTLIKYRPEPVLRIVGNFTDTNVLKSLLLA